MSKNTNILYRIYDRFPRTRRKQLWLLFCGICFAALMETLTMGVVALFASSVTDPDTVLRSSKLAKVNAFFGYDVFSDARSLVVGLSIASALLLLFKNLISAIISYFNGLFSAFVDAYFGDLLLFGLLHKEYQWHLGKNSADLVTAVVWRQFIGNTITYSAVQMLSDMVIVVVLVCALFVAAPAISLVVLSVLGVTALFLYKIFRPFVDKVAHRYSEADMSVNRHVTKALHGIKDVKVFGQEEAFLGDYREDVRTFALSQACLRLLTRSPAWILETVGFCMLSLVVIVLLTLMNASIAKITAIIALLAVAAWRILPAVNRVLSGVTAIRQNTPQASRVLDYIDECSEAAERASAARDSDDSARPLSFNESLVLCDIKYTYPGADSAALSSVVAKVEKGESVGVVGRSGAGKSTMVDIVLGLLRPDEGVLKIDDVALDCDGVSKWMDKIGYVGQTPYIYDGTLAENIAFGFKGAEIDDAKVLMCCRQACIDDFLNGLENGIHTPIGERGTKLSGGQRQRVAIARALYRDPEILILDEATSALDTQSEEAIRKTIRGLAGKLTMLIIAHRLSTVEDCDRIFWLDRGRMREVGPPDELIPRYKEMMRNQLEQ